LFITVLSVFLAAQGPWNEPGQKYDKALNGKNQFDTIKHFFNSFLKKNTPTQEDIEQVKVLITELKSVRFSYNVLIEKLEELLREHQP